MSSSRQTLSNLTGTVIFAKTSNFPLPTPSKYKEHSCKLHCIRRAIDSFITLQLAPVSSKQSTAISLICIFVKFSHAFCMLLTTFSDSLRCLKKHFAASWPTFLQNVQVNGCVVCFVVCLLRDWVK